MGEWSLAQALTAAMATNNLGQVVRARMPLSPSVNEHTHDALI